MSFQATSNNEQQGIDDDPDMLVSGSTQSNVHQSLKRTHSCETIISISDEKESSEEDFGSTDELRQKIHCETEKLRLSGLNKKLQDIADNVPGGVENESKVVKFQRIGNYICFMERVVRDLLISFGIEIDYSSLFLTPTLPLCGDIFSTTLSSDDLQATVADANEISAVDAIGRRCDVLQFLNEKLLKRYGALELDRVKYQSIAKIIPGVRSCLIDKLESLPRDEVEKVTKELETLVQTETDGGTDGSSYVDEDVDVLDAASVSEDVTHSPGLRENETEGEPQCFGQHTEEFNQAQGELMEHGSSSQGARDQLDEILRNIFGASADCSDCSFDCSDVSADGYSYSQSPSLCGANEHCRLMFMSQDAFESHQRHMESSFSCGSEVSDTGSSDVEPASTVSCDGTESNDPDQELIDASAIAWALMQYESGLPVSQESGAEVLMTHPELGMPQLITGHIGGPLLSQACIATPPVLARPSVLQTLLDDSVDPLTYPYPDNLLSDPSPGVQDDGTPLFSYAGQENLLFPDLFHQDHSLLPEQCGDFFTIPDVYSNTSADLGQLLSSALGPNVSGEISDISVPNDTYDELGPNDSGEFGSLDFSDLLQFETIDKSCFYQN